ncbi:Spc7-domain-containing protein [Dacryopinax primogenitus]|uniref:Spc7-domain-containing protein n=1 Tax=Dacryopinax primogenitus (strain DJM 731) TaxID=1858805 RepID=M5FU62_DACPD|nr:Spc7-domain-containing protein [Dacryopinax primogenitus]EJT99708.1 Spc7-domain-containing protein [Dacryopinax primogenitus]
MSTRRETRSSTRKSFPPPDASTEKENIKTRAKRHQSMGGAGASEAPSIAFKELVIKPSSAELSPAKKKRRTAVPRKSILRRRDNEDQTMDLTLAPVTALLPATADGQDFTTIMNFEPNTTDDRRKSLARRVSFASHAHVRLFPKEAPKPDSSSPAPSTSASGQSSHVDPPPSPSPTIKGVSFGGVEDSPKAEGAATGTSHAPKRRSSIANAGALLGHDIADDEDDDSSMDIDDDATNMSISHPSQASPASPIGRVSIAGSVNSEVDMDITTAVGRVEQLAHDDTAEHTASSKSSAGSEFLFPLGKNVPAANPKSRRGSEPSARDKAWAALESVTNGVNNDSSDEDEDMELMDATGRIQAIRRASVMTTGSAMDLDEDDMVTGKIIQGQGGAARMSVASQGSNMDIDDDSSHSDEDDLVDDNDADKTVNLSTMMSRMSELEQTPSLSLDREGRRPSAASPYSPEGEEGPIITIISPTKTAKILRTETITTSKSLVSSNHIAVENKKQTVGDTPTKATLRAIPSGSTRDTVFPSPLRQSPGRILRFTPSKLGSPSRVRIESPMRSPARRSPARITLPSLREEPSSSEELGSDDKPRRRTTLTSFSPASVSASHSQSLLQGLEDISGIIDENALPNNELPVRQLSINEFLEMTGVTFMDGLAVKRRSTVGPGILGSVRDEALDNRGASRAVAEYVSAAAVGIPQLEMYIWACQELKKNIAASQETVHNFDDQVEKSNPLLFQDYMAANEEERPLMEGQLKIMKAHARLCAKEKWYQWRQGLVQDLQNTVTENLTKLQADYEYIQQVQSELSISLPELRARHAALTEQLGMERRNIQEVEGDNAEQVKELREGIAEQNAQIMSFRSDLAEVAVKTERLDGKLADIEEQRRQQLSVITRAEQHCQMLRSCTRSEVFRLKEDYHALERMHLWQVVKFKAAEKVFVYDSRIQVTLSPGKLVDPDGLCLLPGPESEDKLTRCVLEGLFSIIQDGIQSLPAYDAQQVIQVIGSAWTAATHLLLEIHLVNQKYPVSIVPLKSSIASGLVISAQIMVGMSKVTLSFMITAETLLDWPSTSSAIPCDAKLVYGDVEMDAFVEAARRRVRQATPSLFYGYLVDTCREAVASQA